MQDKFSNSRFALLYVWTARAKYTMGLFFILFVHLYLFLGFLNIGNQIVLNLPTSLEMMAASLLIGITQQMIIPVHQLTMKRAISWVVAGSSITLLFSILFNWFAGLPIWYTIFFQCIAGGGMAAILLGYYFELQQETIKLNKQLGHFQENARSIIAKKKED